MSIFLIFRFIFSGAFDIKFQHMTTDNRSFQSKNIEHLLERQQTAIKIYNLQKLITFAHRHLVELLFNRM